MRKDSKNTMVRPVLETTPIAARRRKDVENDSWRQLEHAKPFMVPPTGSGLSER
jgi:hypothetical protein